MPLFGAGIAGKSYVVTRQRRLNCYYENRPDGDKTKIAVFGTPGLTLLPGNVLPIATTAPIRGMIGSDTDCYIVNGSELTAYNSVGAPVSTASLNTVNGPVQMAFNQSQVLIVDGLNGYIMDRSTHLFTTVTSAGFPNGCKTCTFLSGFLIAEKPGTPSFFVSNLSDGLTWDAAATASAFEKPEPLLAVDNLNGNLLLFTDGHTEFWQDVGTIPQPFAIIKSATQEYGLHAIYSRAHIDNSLCLLGETPQGWRQVLKITGYNITPISTTDLEYIINSTQANADAVGIGYVIDKHPMYLLTLPTLNRSFEYDNLTGIWAERQSGITQDYAQRHVGQYVAHFSGKVVVSDYRNRNLYTFDPNSYTDYDLPIEREIITRHVSSNFNEFMVDELYLDMETGLGYPNNYPDNPQIMIQGAWDNGRIWGQERWFGLGKQGQYKHRVTGRRWGGGRDFEARIRMTDPAKFVITEGAMSVRERVQ